MECKTTSGKSQRRAGFVLSEMLVVMGVSTILLVALAAVSMFSSRSFAAIFNYVDLDDANRVAMDQLSRDIRQANRVTAFSTNYLYLEDADLSIIQYEYSSTNRTLTRTKNTASRTILSDCDTLKFDVCQRNPVGGSYDVYPVAT